MVDESFGFGGRIGMSPGIWSIVGGAGLVQNDVLVSGICVGGCTCSVGVGLFECGGRCCVSLGLDSVIGGTGMVQVLVSVGSVGGSISSRDSSLIGASGLIIGGASSGTRNLGIRGGILNSSKLSSWNAPGN